MRLAMRSVFVLALLSAGCAEQAVEPGVRSSDPRGPATLTIQLKDAAGDIQAAVVTISEVYLQGTGGRTVLRSTPYTVDLTSLANTSTVLLQDVQVASGTYAELRFVVTGAYVAVEQAGGGTRIFASAPDYEGLPSGAVVDGDLQMPSFATSGLKVQLPDGGLQVPTSGAVSLLVDFDVAQSFGHQAGNSGKWVMHPVISATGATLGTTLTVTLAVGPGVTLPTGTALADFHATLAAASAPGTVLATAAFSADAGGPYRAALGFVAPGTYLVNVIAPSGVTGLAVNPAVPFAYTATPGPATTLAFTLTPLLTFASVTAGDVHTCGLTPTGAAYCWGSNSDGQLGDGSTNTRLTPVAVVMPASVTFASITAGGFHTCGLTSSGAAYCWGQNVRGQLGDGTTTQQLTATLVTGGRTFTSIAAGQHHTCALTQAGAAYCWGRNAEGQLGNGTTTNASVPTAVTMPAGLTFASITTGVDHSCALTSTNVAYCWGYNFFGQLGDGTTTQQSAPVAVSGGPTFVALNAGYEHTCGLTSAGAAYCWGENTFGQLGGGTTSNGQATPVAVAGGPAFASTALGRDHTCGVTAAGAAWCWGENSRGQLGDATTANKLSPVAVGGGLTLATLDAGFEHTCARTPAGVTYCWGRNAEGQLGDGTTTNRPTPTAVVQP